MDDEKQADSAVVHSLLYPHQSSVIRNHNLNENLITEKSFIFNGYTFLFLNTTSNSFFILRIYFTHTK